MDKNLPQPFRWAILGTGAVSVKFSYGLRALGPDAKIVTVMSRNPDRADAFARRMGADRAVTSIDAAFEGVDAVYVATPVQLHAEHALAAIRAGKPVLVEKPFAMSRDEAETVVHAARAAGVFCMEALWTRFLPLVTEIAQLISAGAVGDIRSFDAGFQIATKFDAGTSLFDAARGGGALRQRGVYPLSLARLFCGPISTIKAVGRLGESGVDEDCALILSHQNGALSTLRASLSVNGPNRAVVMGSKSTIEIDAPVYRPDRARVAQTTAWPAGSAAPRRFEPLRETAAVQRASLALSRLRSDGQRLKKPFEGNGYTHEARAVAAAVQAGLTEHPSMHLNETLELAGCVDRALMQMRTDT